jgi:WD40 repeat protein/tetratricopeptide (TPR) repeat protein
MRKERVRRYRSASELADDIQNYLNGNPLIAGPETTIYRVKKFVRRHAGSVATVALTTAAIILGLVVSTALYIRAERARENEFIARKQAESAEKVAQEQKSIAETKAEDLRRSLYVNSIRLADASYVEGNIARVHEVLNSCPNDLRGWEWNWLNYISDQPATTLYGHKEGVGSIALSPDGKKIVSGSWDGTIRLWDLATGVQLAILRGHSGRVCSVGISPDGTRIASCGDDGTIRIWDASNGVQIMKLFELLYWNYSLSFSPDGKYVAMDHDDGTIKVWDISTGEKVMTLRGNTYTNCAVFSPDGRIVSGGLDKTIKVWDVNTGAELMTMRGHEVEVICISVRPDGKRIVSGSDGGAIKIWDAETGKELVTLHGHRNGVTSISYDRTGRFIVSGSADRTIKVWNAETGEELTTLRGHNGTIRSTLFSPDSKKVISSSNDKTIKIWDLSTCREPLIIGAGERFNSVSFSPDGKRIVSAAPGSARGIRIWDTATGAEVMSFSDNTSSVTEAVFSPDGQSIVSARYDDRRTIKVWDVATGRERMILRGHDTDIISLACSPDGRRIASADREGIIKVWDATTGVELTKAKGPIQWSLTYSPDGTRIISASMDKTIRVCDAENGNEMLTIKGHRDNIRCVAVSHDGKRIASGGMQGTMKIFDAVTGRELMSLAGHRQLVTSITFSPDDTRLVSGGSDGAVKIWDTSTGALLMTVGECAGDVYSVTFSPDGNTIAAGGSDGITLWETSMPASGYSARRVTSSAMKTIDRLYNENGYYYRVMEQIEADKTLDENVRTAALQIVKSRLKLDADKFRAIGSTPGAELKVYREALEKAEMANRLEPNDISIMCAMGVNQYRVGAYSEALETLTQVEKMRADANGLRADVVAVIAMALHKLGKAEEANVAFNRLRNLCIDEYKKLSEDRYARLHVVEAEKLFATGNAKLCSLWDYITADRIEKAVEVLRELRVSEEVESSGLLDGAIKWLSRVSYERASRIWGYAAERDDVIAFYETVIDIDSNNAPALNDWAWLQIACPEATLRDANRIVETANKACGLTAWKNQEYLATLAAAYSEVSDFNNAVKWQKQAIELLPDDKREVLEANYEARLKLYESGKPYHTGSLWSFTHGELVGWWKLDEVKDGNVIDSSGNGLNGRLIGDAKIVSDPHRGNVLSLDGDGDYVNCGHTPTLDITGSVTIAAWVKLEEFHTINSTIAASSGSWGLERYSDTNSVGFYCSFPPKYEEYGWVTGVCGEKQVDDDKWHHVVGVYDGKRIALFIDGTPDSQLNVSGNTAFCKYPFYIGRNSEVEGFEWNGLIDDVRLYSYALSDGEVKAFYEGKDPPRERKSD